MPLVAMRQEQITGAVPDGDAQDEEQEQGVGAEALPEYAREQERHHHARHVHRHVCQRLQHSAGKLLQLF
jgi:hypothetical protein